MTEVYFHCTDAEHFFVDRRRCAMELKEARAHADLVRNGTPSIAAQRGSDGPMRQKSALRLLVAHCSDGPAGS